eukprot:5296462-Lingulodinium_polyedra.AAC.1
MLEGCTHAIWPGKLPFMTGGNVEPYASRTVRALGVPLALNAPRHAADAETGPFMVWGPDHWRDAVAVFP